MDKLTLAKMQAHSTSPDYPGRGFLASSSAVLGLSVVSWLDELSHWQGVDENLSNDEIDDIREMVAQLEYDLIMVGDLYAMDKVKITHDTNQIVATGGGSVIAFNEEIYDPEDMHDVVTNNARVNVLRDGLHLITASILVNLAAIGYRQLHLTKYDAELESSTAIAVYRTTNIVSSATYTMQLSTQDEAKAGDYYYLVATQTSGGNMTLYSVDYSPIFTVVRL